MDSEIGKQLLAYGQFLLMTVFHQVWVWRPRLCRILLLRDRVGWRVPRAAAKRLSATTAAQVSSEISNRRICNRKHFPAITLYKQLFMKSAYEFKLCQGRYNPNSIGNIKYFMLSKHSDVIFKVRLPFEKWSLHQHGRPEDRLQRGRLWLWHTHDPPCVYGRAGRQELPELSRHSFSSFSEKWEQRENKGILRSHYLYMKEARKCINLPLENAWLLRSSGAGWRNGSPDKG